MEFVIFRVIFPAFLAITALSVRTTSAPALQNNNGKQLKAAPHSDKPKRPSWDRAAGLKDPNKAWPDAVVPYTISADFDQDHFEVIKSAMIHISRKTCITFTQRNNEDDFVSIEIGGTCYSRIGRVGGYQELVLEAPGCGDSVGVVMHELLHALGLIHEQSRPDRDRYVDIAWENIIDNPDYVFNFNEYDWDEVQNLTVPYDLTSLMHYNPYAFSKNGDMTIIPKGNGMIPDEVDDMSDGDADFINFMYCSSFEK